MYVEPLGTNGLYPDENNPTSGYLLSAGDKKFLIDVGSGVFSKLKNIVKIEELDGVIVTHYHFDHVSDIGVLSYYLQTRNRKLKVYAPNDGSEFQNLIKNSPFFDFIPINESEPLVFDDLKIEFYKTNHPVLTYGVVVFYSGKKFTYTSDGNICDNLYKMLENSDLAVIDCGFLFADWSTYKPLLSAEHVGLIAKKCGVKRALISHFKPTISKEELITEAKSAYDKVEPCMYERYVI